MHEKGMGMEEKTRLIQELDQAHAKMQMVLMCIDTQMEVYANWTIKQVLAHLAGWDDATASSLRAHAGGQEPAVPVVHGINFYNAQSVETREALSYEQTIKEWELARERLKAAVKELPLEKFDEPLLFPWGPTGTVAELVGIFVEHEEEHAEEIHNLIKQRRK
jgi:hypothetical protein